MDHRKKTNSSLPSNYVSLVQLKERWLQEKERKRKEKEEEEEREVRRRVAEEERKRREKQKTEEEKEREERRRREQRRREDKRKNQRLNQGVDGGNNNETQTRRSDTRCRSRRSDQKMLREVRGNVDERRQKPEEKEAVAVVEVARIDANEELKNKGNKKKKKSKTRADKGQLIPENEPEISMPMALSEKKDETREITKHSFQRCETSVAANRKILKEKSPVNVVVDIGRKFENFSIKGCGTMDTDGNRRVYRSYRRPSRLEVQRPRNCSLVWVKKEESSSGGNVAVGQSSRNGGD